MTTPRPGENATPAPTVHDETGGVAESPAIDRAETTSAPPHPCAARPVPASVQRQRDIALDTAFARAARDADEAPVVTTPSRTNVHAAHEH
jgi:hypothetical protein